MISLDTSDGVATLTLDDGKRNAMNFAWFDAFDGALTEVEQDEDAKVLLVAGREGTFSAGLDLKLLPTLDGEGLARLITQFARVMHRVWLFPKPVVAACTGHALGGGTILSMCCDHAVAADGDAKWGLNELQVGIPVPTWIVAIARGNVSPRDLDRLVLRGAVVGANEAVEVGFADELAPADEVFDVARSAAEARVALSNPAFTATKRFLREPLSGPALDGLEAELKALFAG